MAEPIPPVQLISLRDALRAYVEATETQSSRHIKPLHGYIASRLVIEGGFDPTHIIPRPPFRIEVKGSGAAKRRLLTHDSEVTFGHRSRNEEGDQRGPLRVEVLADAFERARHGGVVGEEGERRPGQEDRPVRAPEIHPLDGRVMHGDLEAAVGGSPSQLRQHVGRRIQSLDVKPIGAQRQQRIAVAAPEFQGRLFGYIFSLLGDPDRANDVLQEANMVLWRDIVP